VLTTRVEKFREHSINVLISPEIPESGGNKPEIQNHPTRYSGKPENVLSVPEMFQPYL
jgi:hypothetical protein